MKRSISQFEAIGLALASYTLWVLADTSLKIAGASTLPAYEVIALVGLAEMVLLLGRALVTRKLKTLWPVRPVRQVLRSCLDLANNVCVVIALRHLPLALFYILIFFAPMVTTVLEAVFLTEPLHWKRVLAVLTGFAGVVVAVDPFGVARPSDWTGYLACLVCVTTFSINMVWSRLMTQTESSESLTFCSGAVMALVGGAAMLGHAAPFGARLVMILSATGLFCVVGSLTFFAALKYASAATVAQYHYSQLLTGAVLGYVIWRDKLSAHMVLGALFIIGAGVYTAAKSYSRPVVGAAAGTAI